MINSVERLQAENAALTAQVAVLEAEIEQACADCCELCREGRWEPYRSEVNDSGTWWHQASKRDEWPCAASGIRERAWARKP